MHTKLSTVVYNRNQVSVSGTETKVHFGFGIGAEFFFSETETLDFSHVSDFVRGLYSFYKLENKARPSKII